jgi:hypothetical protein
VRACRMSPHASATLSDRGKRAAQDPSSVFARLPVVLYARKSSASSVTSDRKLAMVVAARGRVRLTRAARVSVLRWGFVSVVQHSGQVHNDRIAGVGHHEGIVVVETCRSPSAQVRIPGGGSTATESVAEQAKRRLLVVEESVFLT